jgi:hypothetical protein
MPSQYWLPTFAEAIAKANSYFFAHQYADAEVEYLVAASVIGRWSARELMALQCAWVSRERAEGRLSKLDYEAWEIDR